MWHKRSNAAKKGCRIYKQPGMEDIAERKVRTAMSMAVTSSSDTLLPAYPGWSK